jgi:hypothetical protein
MKKILALLSIFFLSQPLFAQKDTIIFLYRGSMYPPHDTTINKGIKKDINFSNGDVLFSIAGANGTNHLLMYSNILSEKEFITSQRILLSKRVYYLDYLAFFDEKRFLKEFGYIGRDNYKKNTVVFLVPLLDMGAYKGPSYEVLFVSTFLEPEE